MPRSQSDNEDEEERHPHTHKIRSKVHHLASVISELKVSAAYAINPQHRHDEDHEKARDAKLEAIRDAHRFRSFAPIRGGNIVKFAVDGHDYFWQLSEIIDHARETIFIMDWWLSPELYLRRPPALYPEYRLDRLLQRKAQEGVMIYISVYKEVEASMSLSSVHTKHWLESLHKNIVVMRHPSHDYGELTMMWSHHEKLCLVDNRIAAMGGLDACFGRWDTSNHELADVHPQNFYKTLYPGQDYNNSRLMDFQTVDQFTSNALAIQDAARMPWHDNSLTFVGPSVVDLAQHFIERWNFIKSVKYKHDRHFEYLALPAPFDEIQPSDAAVELIHDAKRREQRRMEHPHIAEWADKGRQWFHPYHNPPSDLPRADEKVPQGDFNVQVLRSASDWSHGFLTETSIQDAYCQLIRESNHTIFIENQFFVTSTIKGHPVHNQIGAAIAERIISAARDGRRFKVIVLIPALPAFAGEVQGAPAVKAIIEAQYRSINRGGDSIMETVRRAGFDPELYISFWNLRSYDRINSPRDTIKRMEQNSGVTFHQAQVALSRLWAGNPTGHKRERDEVVILSRPHDQSTDMNHVAEKQTVNQGVRMPSTVEEALELIKRFEAGAGEEHRHISDNVGQHSQICGTTLFDEKWDGTEQEELESYISELTYIHSKLMIVDDCKVLIGSANLNDRSQMGERDSEIAICIEEKPDFKMTMDGKPHMASKLATSWRRRLMREHLGLLPATAIPLEKGDEPHANQLPAPVPNEYDFGSAEDLAVEDVLSDDFERLWTGTGERNRAAFEKVFRVIPNNQIHTWAEYTEYTKIAAGIEVGHVSDRSLSLQQVKETLAEIRGHLVPMPLGFLDGVKELTAGDYMSVNAYTLPIYL